MLYRLSNPTATLYGFDQNGTDHSIILTLSSLTADSANKVCSRDCAMHSGLCIALTSLAPCGRETAPAMWRHVERATLCKVLCLAERTWCNLATVFEICSKSPF